MSESTAARSTLRLCLLESELAEGRAHFAQRADPRVRDTKDFLAEALLRAARERSGA